MKSILSVIQGYLRRFPNPIGIEMIQNSLLKLTYNFSTPYTDSKTSKDIFLPFAQLQKNKKLEVTTQKLSYNEKGRIQEVGTFDSIMISQKHQKLLQDDVFGRARLSQDKNRWVYVAQVKQQKTKSYFTKGEGKKIFEYDFGETYDDVKHAKIFVWDKKKKQVLKIETAGDLIPACPVFSNSSGNRIIFHAYKRTDFGHGLLHCFNREVGIYEIDFEIEDQIEDAEKQAQIAKAQVKAQKQRLKKLPRLVQDGGRANIFPSISKCFNYLVYCSGSGITHTHYLDLVVMKRENNKWTELHRVKDRLVGFYCTLKLFTASDHDNKPICYFQTIDKAVQRIYKLNIESGEITEFSKNETGQSFAISDILESGQLLGTTSTQNYNSFFYTKNNNTEIEVVPPKEKQDFVLHQYSDPIPAFYLQAKQSDILNEFKHRANKRPLVLIAHGGPHGSMEPALTLFKYALLKMGYAILMPNYSGSAGFGQKYLEGAMKSIGQTDAKQMISLLQKVLNQRSYIDKKSVHVYGGSYGGFTGGIMGSRYSQHFKSVVIMNGVLSIPANLFFTDIPEWNTVETLGKEDLHNLTAEDYVDMWKQSPISQPMKIPALQFLGAKDRRVPYKQGLLFDAMTKRSGSQISTYVYQNSSHSLADSVQTSIDIITKTLLFLQGKLKKVEQSEQKPQDAKQPQKKQQSNTITVDKPNKEQEIIS